MKVRSICGDSLERLGAPSGGDAANSSAAAEPAAAGVEDASLGSGRGSAESTQLLPSHPSAALALKHSQGESEPCISCAQLRISCMLQASSGHWGSIEYLVSLNGKF